MVTEPITNNSNDKNLAVNLRKQGLMYQEISIILNKPKSTVYSWLSHIELTDEELNRIRLKLNEKRKSYSSHMNEAKKQKRIDIDKDINNKAKNIVNGASTEKNRNLIILSVLYWGEGEKNISSGMRFINSDPIMIKTFATLFRKSFKVDEKKFRVMLHVHSYHDVDVEIKYWSEITGVPEAQFYKPYIKPNTGKQKKSDYHGTISFRYNDYKLGKLLKMVYTVFSQNIGV